MSLGALFVAAPAKASSLLRRSGGFWRGSQMRRGVWLYADTGKPSEFWNGWDRSDAERLSAHERAWEEMPPSLSKGCNPMVAANVETTLAEEEARFASDREKFRAEYGLT